MATQKINLSFQNIRLAYVETGMSAIPACTIDGVQVVTDFIEYPTNPQIQLAPSFTFEWDVSAKQPGQSLDIVFNVALITQLWTSTEFGGLQSQAQVQLTLYYPFTDVQSNLVLPSPAIPSDDPSEGQDVSNAFWLTMSYGPAEYQATAQPNEVYVQRNADGTETFTTISGTSISPRVEICPVIPVPSPLPARALVNLPSSFIPIALPCSNPFPLVKNPQFQNGIPPLNSLVNPSFIPVLFGRDPLFHSKVARIAVTYMDPADLDTSYFTWVIKSGPIEFVGPTQGQTEVQVYATAASADTPAQIELHWDGPNGPLLCSYRALVGQPRNILFRANIINGSDAANQPRATPDDVAVHIAMANILLWQSGLHLFPDTDPQVWDHATATKHSGIFRVKLAAKNNGWTTNVDPDLPLPATRLNFRPKVVQFVYIKSAVGQPGLVGEAVDRPRLEPELNGKGPPVTDNRSPSTSWVVPSGIPPDGAAGTVTMFTMYRSPPRTDADDLAYAKNRHANPNIFEDLHAVILCDNPSFPPQSAEWGQAIAHEFGHVLGLMHRGNGGHQNRPGPSDDGINDPNGQGYPWVQNVMCYGFDMSQDLDLIQTPVIRKTATLLATTP